jgi:hypothetical protein
VKEDETDFELFVIGRIFTFVTAASGKTDYENE